MAVRKILPVALNHILDDTSSSSSSSSSFSSLSDSEDEVILHNSLMLNILLVNELHDKVMRRIKIDNYVEGVIPGYTKHVFKEHFRMFPETFESVLSLIGSTLTATNRASGRKPIDAKTQLLVALWYMSTPDSYRSVCEKFGIGKATAFRAVRRVTYALYCLASRVIQWPKHQHAIEVMNNFEKISGFPNVIGAIDGSHIRIRAPKIDSVSYINRKGDYSIILQAVCNSNCIFTHCYAGHVGSVHDARVFRNSPISNFIEMPDEYFPNDSHIIGDAAYPIHPHIMVPFRDNGFLTIPENNYNYCLSSTRMVIERAFGLLKMRFRMLLDCVPLLGIKHIPEFIIACCVLHNICMSKGDIMNVLMHRCNERIGPFYENNSILGNEKRERIMNRLRIRL